MPIQIKSLSATERVKKIEIITSGDINNLECVEITVNGVNLLIQTGSETILIQLLTIIREINSKV